MSQDNTPNQCKSDPAPPVDIDAELAAQARKVTAVGTGWRYQKSAFPYEMAGVMDEGCIESRTRVKKHFIAKGPPPALPAGTHPALGFRAMANELFKVTFDEQTRAPTFVEEITFQGEDFTKDGDKRDLKLLLNRPKTTKHSKENPSPALMYLHGGGAIAFNAKCSDAACQRWADENDLVVFNLDYRLAPETPAPGGILDCYAGLKFIIANAEKYGIDPTRVTFTGDSGGGYLSMGLGMELSKRGESGIVPFIIGSACMVGGIFWEMTEEDKKKGDDIEKTACSLSIATASLAGVAVGTPYEQIKDRVDVFVTNMPDEILKNFPPTVLFTSEFDICRWGTEVMAQLLEKHGKLLDYIVHPGATHCWYFADHKNRSPSTQKCWDDYGKVFKRYLKGEITTAQAE
jgi:acetyl esterase/lipase